MYLLQGPPPGFGTPAATSNGNAPSGFPPQSASNASGISSFQQADACAPPQLGPHQHWSAFHQSYPSPIEAGENHTRTGLHQSYSAGPAEYQARAALAMPGLSSLQQSGSEHSLFSGSADLPGFCQSQYRQRSRFQFAQEHCACDGRIRDSMLPSMLSCLVLQSSPEHSHAEPQDHHQRHSREHQLFPAGPGLVPASLFAGMPKSTTSMPAVTQGNAFAGDVASVNCAAITSLTCNCLQQLPGASTCTLHTHSPRSHLPCSMQYAALIWNVCLSDALIWAFLRWGALLT